MLLPHLRKFTDLYENFGLGAVKNIWLLVSLLPLVRTVNLLGILPKENQALFKNVQ